MLNYFFALIIIGISSSCSPSRIPVEHDIFLSNEIEPRIIPPKILPPLIVIDPGHGGEDQGTKSLLQPSYQEKFLTLSTANLLKDYLKKLGYRTKMTRNEDIFIPLSDRAKMANEANATYFISVHYNSAPSKEAHGIEVFYYEDQDIRRINASRALAGDVLEKVTTQCKAKSRGVKTANFAVIRETKMPAILVECGFLTNTEEMEKIKDPQYLKMIAWGIAQGIDQYSRLNSKL